MLIQHRRFASGHNEQLIKLIKQKMSPLQRSKKARINVPRHQLRGQVKDVNRSQRLGGNRLSFPNLFCSAQVTPPDENQGRESGVLERVREYLLTKKISHYLPEARVELAEYLQIFKTATGETKTEKKELLQPRIPQSLPARKDCAVRRANAEVADLSDEQMTILNAKFRQRLNHRKMIEIFRR